MCRQIGAAATRLDDTDTVTAPRRTSADTGFSYVSQHDTMRLCAPTGVTSDTRQHTRKTPVLFIHGLWLHAASWQPWVCYFNRAGYLAMAPGWPDFQPTVALSRVYPECVHDVTLGQVVEHYVRIIKSLRVRPVVIGHAYGGLVALRLLDRRVAAAVIAIDPIPVKGVWPLPLSQLRVALPVLANPYALHGSVSLRPRQFRYAFANRLSEAEAATIYEAWTIPAPGRPLWEVMTANFVRQPPTAVRVSRCRAPLLLMSGLRDRIVTPETTRAVQRLYKKSPSHTDLKEWPGRGHSLVVDRGWVDLADYALAWLQARRLGQGS